MKKFLLAAAVALGAMTANAQALESPGFLQNWSVGIDGGVTTPLKDSPFFKSMRALVGVEVRKQITPTFGLGVESQFGVNTSHWKGRIRSATAFDNAYIGTFGTVDLFNLFGGYPCKTRVFSIEAMAGAGWGHYMQDLASHNNDWNFFATKAGLNFNFNISDHFTIAIKPAVTWSMNGGHNNNNTIYPDVDMAGQSETYYDAHRATFDIQAGLIWHLSGHDFACVQPRNQAELDALNAQINELQAAIAACMVNGREWEAKANQLAKELAACMNRKPQVEVKEVVKTFDTNTLTSIRYVFYKIGSSVITADQMPNVVMIADYLKHNPKAHVDIKGYASQDGNLDFNIKLANARAESVKNALINKYGIKADRITAEGQGIGHMFKEESWNRVSICVLEDAE